MSIFVDTSALYALLTTADDNHRRARGIWQQLRERRQRMITSNYVLVEALTLIQRRLGVQAMRDFQREFVPVLDVVWVDESLHQLAVAALLLAGLRGLSLVDCVNFEIMHKRNLENAFAFDAHFGRQGFVCLS